MAEALAVVGLISAIVQFLDFSSKLVTRLNEFQSAVGDVPKTFQDIKTELPLLLDTLKRTREQFESGQISKATQEALIPVVDGCCAQVVLLDSTLIKTLPTPTESSWKRD